MTYSLLTFTPLLLSVSSVILGLGLKIGMKPIIRMTNMIPTNMAVPRDKYQSFIAWMNEIV